MPSKLPRHTVDAVRGASRRLVRELGFMGGDFAGTGLPPSSVHALIEIEPGGMTARDLGALLHLEKSSVSRMLRKLGDAGYVTERPADDGRLKLLSLTATGQQRVADIHIFARAQVSEALGRLDPGQAQTIVYCLDLYAAALAAKTDVGLPPPEIEIVSGYRTGTIASITEMHARYYAQASGFGQRFESVVASGLAEFCNRLENPENGIWMAMQDSRIVGSVAIDGEDLGEGEAHLRWFIVEDGLQGRGVGKSLLSAALGFADARGVPAIHLWTFADLSSARHLYEAHGFVLTQDRPGDQWGTPIREQRFVRQRPPG